MKILYACRKSYTSKIQCERFLETIKNNYQIKVAAYQEYIPFNFCEFTLDSLNYDKKHSFGFKNNDNLDLYKQQIKRFNPDLVISDLEEYSSHAAIELNIPLWHVSQDLLYLSLPTLIKQKIQLYRYHSNILFDDKKLKIIKSLINKAQKNYVYSHFANVGLPISKKFSWVKPYYYVGKQYGTCQHQYVAIDINNNYNILGYLRNKKDCILFSNSIINIDAVTVKDLRDKEEYICNLFNSDCIICNGNEHVLADCLYNKKDCIIIPDKLCRESMVNYSIYKFIHSSNLLDDVILDSSLYEDSNAKYLHQLLESI